MKLYEYQRSRSLIDLSSTFSNFFFLETAQPIEAKFYVEPPWDTGMKVCSTGPSHMTKMAAMPIYGKSLKSLLLRNQKEKADDLETWYAALGPRVLPTLFKLWSCVDLDLVYGKIKFGPLFFCTGKRLNNGFFFRNYCSLWCQSW